VLKAIGERLKEFPENSSEMLTLRQEKHKLHARLVLASPPLASVACPSLTFLMRKLYASLRLAGMASAPESPGMTLSGNKIQDLENLYTTRPPRFTRMRANLRTIPGVQFTGLRESLHPQISQIEVPSIPSRERVRVTGEISQLLTPALSTLHSPLSTCEARHLDERELAEAQDLVE